MDLSAFLSMKQQKFFLGIFNDETRIKPKDKSSNPSRKTRNQRDL